MDGFTIVILALIGAGIVSDFFDYLRNKDNKKNNQQKQ